MFTVQLNEILDVEIPSNASARIDYEQRLDMLKEMQEDIKTLVQSTRELAIDDGFAEMVIGKQSELAPTKPKFIELYGQEEFDLVKRLGKAKETFTWK
tara:strand:- start:31 stop:324 length:294 start_codon:yes stop_codon:yes gene_type:complete